MSKDYRLINVKIREIAVPKTILDNNLEFHGLKNVKIYKMGYVTIVLGNVNGSSAVIAYHISRKPTIEEIFRIRKELLGNEHNVYLTINDMVDEFAVSIVTVPADE